MQIDQISNDIFENDWKKHVDWFCKSKRRRKLIHSDHACNWRRRDRNVSEIRNKFLWTCWNNVKCEYDCDEKCKMMKLKKIIKMRLIFIFANSFSNFFFRIFIIVHEFFHLNRTSLCVYKTDICQRFWVFKNENYVIEIDMRIDRNKKFDYNFRKTLALDNNNATITHLID